MSSYARRRCFKIVAPLTPSREAEIAGGLKNALDRGETLAKAKQSFLNAGYKIEEINAAVQKMPAANSQLVKPLSTPAEPEAPVANQPAVEPVTANQPAVKPATQTLPTTTPNIPGQKQELSKKFIIILVSISALILIGAALLGIFWNKIF